MSASNENLKLRVQSIAYQGEGLNAYELVDPNGAQLPAYGAGAHLDIHLPGQLIRQYSLCGDPTDRYRYLLCVQRDDNGTGGSKAVHETIRVGESVSVSMPRNNFELIADAASYLFVVGGIGITPVMSMLYSLRNRRANWRLYYCTRARENTAFLSELADDIQTGRVTVHHDGGQPKDSLDLQSLLSQYEPGMHLYYCGPSGFMAAAEKACAHWPDNTVHFEYFSVADDALPAAVKIDSATTGADTFQIKVNSTGAIYDVPEGMSIVRVLADNGINVATSCESGLCGTCRTTYLEGQPDHRDYILSEEEKADSVLICCARSLSPLLVLDL